MGRPPPDPELVRRVCERRRAGVSFRDLAREAGKDESTVRRWVSDFGEPAPPPLILREPLPAPPDEEAGLVGQLRALAGELSAEQARVVLRAADALQADEADEAPDPAVDTRGWILSMIARVQRSYDRAEATQNATAAKQYAAALERWAGRLKQHDAARGGEDSILIPRAAIEERRAELRDTLARLTAEPLRCVDCGRAVRVRWAEGSEP